VTELHRRQSHAEPPTYAAGVYPTKPIVTESTSQRKHRLTRPSRRSVPLATDRVLQGAGRIAGIGGAGGAILPYRARPGSPTHALRVSLPTCF
jgi:hypothetical protein